VARGPAKDSDATPEKDDSSPGGDDSAVSADQEKAPDQEQLIAEHEAAHGLLPKRILSELRSGAQKTSVASEKAAGVVGEATEALRLEVVETKLSGPRVLVGHALGMRLLIPAEGIHGPRETAALLYLFGDALAIRPTDDSPMSAVPLYGLHIVMPHVAVARWMYKAGRTAHANIDLAKEDEKKEEASIATWTVDDFRRADGKLQVFMFDKLEGEVYLYQRLGLVRLALQLVGGPIVRLKSALPETSGSYQRLWDLFVKVLGPTRLTIDKPAGEHDEHDEHEKTHGT
jgi:hypothetical protein